MASRSRHPHRQNPQTVRLESSSAALRSRASDGRKPYIPARETITRILASAAGKGHGNSGLVARALIATAGSLKPHQLAPAHVREIYDRWEKLSSNTRHTYASRLRAHLETIGASWQCHQAIPHIGSSGPRNTVAPEEEFALVLRHSSNGLRLALLLMRYCALRAGTAMTLKPSDVDTEQWQIRRRSKGGHAIAISVPSLVRETLRFALHVTQPNGFLINALGTPGANRKQIYDNLSHEFCALRERLQLAGTWTFHDLRRTAARSLYDKTKDLRLVQQLLGHANLAQTMWYLQDCTVTLTPEHMEALLHSEMMETA